MEDIAFASNAWLLGRSSIVIEAIARFSEDMSRATEATMPPLPKCLDDYIGDRPLLWADIQMKREAGTDHADIVEGVDFDVLHLNDVLVHANIDVGERTTQPGLSAANGRHRRAVELPALS